MSVDKFLNIVRMHSQLANSSRTFSCLGVITGYDPNNYLVTVELYGATDDAPALQTGSIPLFSPWVGNGWGLFAPPNLGDIVEVHFQEGSVQNAYACLRCYNNNFRPLSVASGEFWLVHQSGSFVKLTNDGKLLLNGNVELDLTSPVIKLTATTQIDLTAPIININSGDVSLGNLNDALTGLMNNIAINVYNEHTHNVVGGGITDAPNQLLDTSALTTNVKAN
jgi:hypothetical protein